MPVIRKVAGHLTADTDALAPPPIRLTMPLSTDKAENDSAINMVRAVNETADRSNIGQ